MTDPGALAAHARLALPPQARAPCPAKPAKAQHSPGGVHPGIRAFVLFAGNPGL